jgi:hypothetical protein
MANDPAMISSNACIERHFNMQRKTAFEVLSTGDSVEIHSWLRTATVKELRDAFEAVKRHDTWGSHVRDALDIRIAANSQRTANLVLTLTIVAVICGAIQALGVFWMIFHTH